MISPWTYEVGTNDPNRFVYFSTLSLEGFQAYTFCSTVLKYLDTSDIFALKKSTKR